MLNLTEGTLLRCTWCAWYNLQQSCSAMLCNSFDMQELQGEALIGSSAAPKLRYQCTGRRATRAVLTAFRNADKRFMDKALACWYLEAPAAQTVALHTQRDT